MFSGFDEGGLDTLKRHIDLLERRSLESAAPNEFDIADIFDGHSFLSIEGLANFWSADAGVDFEQHITDLVVGASSQDWAELTFVLAGTPQGLSVYISLGDFVTTKTMLKGLLPGIHLDTVPITNLTQRLSRQFQVKGVISGIPGRKISASGASSQNGSSPVQASELQPAGAGAQELSRLERIVRGMYGATWAYVVQAAPRPRHQVSKLRLERIDSLAEVLSQTRRQLQQTEQKTVQNSTVSSGSTTSTLSGEIVNYRAQYLARLLEHEIERLDQASASGQWKVDTYFGASAYDEAQRLAALLTATLGGKESRPDPLRASLCSKNGHYLSEFSTLLSSTELSLMIQFPREEVPGYAISDFVRFDVDFRIGGRDKAHSYEKMIELGHIQHNDVDAAPYQIRLNDLTKHAVVLGVTGSGKTTTIMNLLNHLADAAVPFLIIEPAKTEYRALRPRLAKQADVRIYTLGNETIAPFRLNPFEFETDDTPGNASLVNHIDFLKAVFNSAFILYAPMPYILEIALHEIYEEKGWDLTSGLNTRLPKWSERHSYPIFPTLTDLYHKVEDVVNRFKYDPHTEQTVKGGLKARIGSMRIGSKGQMLDTARGISMQQLLSHPTILEMEHIGGDDEKTFLMGMLLAKLYEYRRLQAASGSIKPGLQHVLVFEEAHRLLKNTETQVDTESSNMRAQAIEVFTNMLSEVRAYGQGVLVAEQIPSKLAPDVLKNTNLKIAHRLVAQDDRISVGQSMNLNAEQMNHLGTLATGMAALYAEGADHAYKVRLDNYKHALPSLPDAQLKTESPKYISLETSQIIADYHRYGITRTVFNSPDALLIQYANRLLDTEHGRRLWAQIILRVVFSRAQMPAALKILEQHIIHEIPSLQVKQETLMRMLIVRGCAETLFTQGATFGLPYPIVEELRISLTQGMVAFLQTRDIAVASSDLDRFARNYEKRFERSMGPFAGCFHCRQICQYRSPVRDLLVPADSKLITGELTNPAYKTRADRYAAAGLIAKSIAERWLGQKNEVAEDLAYCASLHIAAAANMADDEQKFFGDSFSAVLLK